MASPTGTDYKIEKASGVCAATGQTMEPGGVCFAALVEIPPENREPGDELGLKRLDVAETAWRDGFRPDGLFSYWQTVVPEPNAKKKVFVDDAVLLSLLDRLADAQETPRQALRFVIALILLRKKMLRHDGTSREAGDPVWLLTPKLDPAKGPLGKWDDTKTQQVRDPGMDEEAIRAVTDQLGEVLAAEL